MSSYLFTSESVTEGHPDKIADQISDAVLDYIIERDKNARVACETLLANGLCIVSGELKTEAYAPIQEIARGVIEDIGYTDANFGLDSKSVGVLNCIGEQSPDINMGVDKDNGEIGAGDQGMMFGYACDESPTALPLALYLAHKITRSLTHARKSGELPFLRPDDKSQVTIRYENGVATEIDSIVVAAQHSPIERAVLESGIIDGVLKKCLPEHLFKNPKIYINRTGNFEIGGPMADVGLTGRKIVIDTYGGYCPHGGGAFSGKDPTKVDRSGAYMARYIAKNLVAAKVAKRVLIQLSYAIGVAHPISVYIDTYGTSSHSNERIIDCILKIFDLTPAGIIRELDLTQPIYRKTAAYGHFGREDVQFSWERTDKAQKLSELLG